MVVCGFLPPSFDSLILICRRRKSQKRMLPGRAQPKLKPRSFFCRWSVKSVKSLKLLKNVNIAMGIDHLECLWGVCADSKSKGVAKGTLCTAGLLRKEPMDHVMCGSTSASTARQWLEWTLWLEGAVNFVYVAGFNRFTKYTSSW